ncbi:MAG: RNA methyltransferase [Tissierellia bacterium]|nr:RNA methyltransferase [Tissierellia bacterium]
MVIESKNNKIFKKLKKRLNKKYRQQERIFLVEGPVVIEEAIKYFKPLEIAIAKNKLNEYRSFLMDLPIDRIYTFSEELFHQLADAENPQGIIGYFPFLDGDFKDIKKQKGKYIYCDNIREPGNLGGMIRSADAFGMDGVLISPHSVEVYNPKTIRSTMASIFRIPIYLVELEDLFQLPASLLVSTVDQGKKFTDLEIIENQILVIGNEAHGVRREILDRADQKVYIPMRQGVDSLNANVAASILMYEMTKL